MTINSLKELCKLTVGVIGGQDGGNVSIADLHLDDDEEGNDSGVYFFSIYLSHLLLMQGQ